MYGSWAGAGNAYHEPWTQADGMVYINLPKMERGNAPLH